MKRGIEFQQITDKKSLREFLLRDQMSAAYLFGDLEEPFFRKCKWYAGFYAGKVYAIVLVFEGLSVPTVLTYGAPDLIEGIMKRFHDSLPSSFHAHLMEEHLPIFSGLFQMSSTEKMWRMGLLRKDFIPTRTTLNVRKLTTEDSIDDILEVYENYPGHFFEPSQLEEGLYFGGFLDSRLVSIAGTHVYAPREKIAVLGNIVTSAKQRGKAYARSCTSELLRELFQYCCKVCLNVKGTDVSAIACYRRLGFIFHRTLVQTYCRQTKNNSKR